MMSANICGTSTVGVRVHYGRKHGLCTYSETQKVAKVKAQRANLEKTDKYKHEDYRVPDIDVGGIANLCCMNVIKLDAKDGGKIDAKDIQQTAPKRSIVILKLKWGKKV